MNANIIKLIDKLESGRLIGRPLMEPEDIEAALDARDGQNFDSKWVSLSDEIEKRKNLEPEQENALEKIRELAYKAAYKTSNHADFAGYVSDDFDLIGNAILLEISDTWLAGLFAEYIDGRFPSGEIKEAGMGLDDLLKSY